MRVALGAVARSFLEALGIEVRGHVVSIGNVHVPPVDYTLEDILRSEQSPVRVVDDASAEAMTSAIDKAKEAGDTLGGTFEIKAFGLPAGLGSYVQWHRRIEGHLAQALLSIPAMKAVEVGAGFAQSDNPGSAVHDAIWWEQGQGFTRLSNRAGGIEGGITTGMPLVVRVGMKPLSTLLAPLGSFDIDSKEPFLATVERSDVTAVPAAVVVGEAMVMHVLADALLEKFGGDSLPEILARVQQWETYGRQY
jgi:chorismate synthase